MAKNATTASQAEKGKSVDRRKKRKFVQLPRKKADNEFDLAVRQLAESDRIIADAEAAVMRFSEELYMLQQSFSSKDQMVIDAHRLLDVAQSRLGAAVMNKQKAQEIVSKRASKRKK